MTGGDPQRASEFDAAAPAGPGVERTGPEGQTLACGASADDILEQVAEDRGDGLDAHQSGCVHCQAALGAFRQLWLPVSAAIAAPVAVPDGFGDLVMAQVRRLTKDVWHTLELNEDGSIRVAARVVATVARDAARRIPGVRVALGRSSDRKTSRLVEKATFGHRHPHSAVGVLGRTAVVDMAIAVTYGEPAHDVASSVQRAVISRLQDDIGLKTVTVNVVVDDVIERA